MTDSIYDFRLQRIDGGETTLEDFRGQVLLVVNLASKCGFTKQYEGLQQLYETCSDRGFSVLGFPANDFANQEPGENEEIRQFCTTSFGVDFPLFAKTQVTGPDKHPLYALLTGIQPEATGREAMETSLKGYRIEPLPVPEVIWNFEKFLLDRNGRVVGRFAPQIAPGDAPLTEAIEAALAAG